MPDTVVFSYVFTGFHLSVKINYSIVARNAGYPTKKITNLCFFLTSNKKHKKSKWRKNKQDGYI